ncbi:hypothetical protein CHU98_g1012 [Xylaria longipes]|nr:hypothetical protein CHU98_g1012 [Xylaria longipes]
MFIALCLSETQGTGAGLEQERVWDRQENQRMVQGDERPSSWADSSAAAYAAYNSLKLTTPFALGGLLYEYSQFYNSRRTALRSELPALRAPFLTRQLFTKT